MPSRATIIAYLATKLELERLQQAMTTITKQMVEEMEEERAKTFQMEDNGRMHRFTYVRRETPVIDEKGLRRALTARVYDKFTTKKLNRKALEAAMDTGVVDTKLVLKYVQMKDGEPYIKYTASKEDE